MTGLGPSLQSADYCCKNSPDERPIYYSGQFDEVKNTSALLLSLIAVVTPVAKCHNCVRVVVLKQPAALSLTCKMSV